MQVCDICSQPRNGGDVLCNTCRETISRLAVIWNELPVVPIAGAAGQGNASAKANAAEAQGDSKQRFLRFSPFAWFQRGKAAFQRRKAAEAKKVSVSQNPTIQIVREK